MKIKLLLILGLIINLFIWTNSLMPASISSNQSDIIVNILYPPFKNLVDVNMYTKIIRKLAHFTEFLLLGIVFSLFYSFKTNKYYLTTFIHGLLVSVIDETIQLFVPGRAGLITDVLIDTIGVIVGIILIKLTKVLLYDEKSIYDKIYIENNNK